VRRANQSAVRARPRSERPERVAPVRQGWLLNLQASAGNKAVAGLVTAGTLLRKPKDKPEPRKTPGWDLTRKGKRVEPPQGDPNVVGGWNLQAHLVAGGEVWRVPIQDLTLGNQAAFAPKTLPMKVKDKSDPTGKKWKTVEVESAEPNKTEESAAGRAIVLVHKNLQPDQEVGVLLHLHGWGWRSKPDDPFAGWRERDKKVRDVAQDRIADQMKEAKNPQIIGILPQGVGKSYFGNLAANAQQYIEEVVKRVVAVASGTQIRLTQVPPSLRLVLSAHSGGGGTVQSILSSKTGIKPAEVVLFDAINGTNERDAVIKWARTYLDEIAGASTPKERTEKIEACPVLRAYFSDDYVGHFTLLDKAVTKLFTEVKLKPADEAAVRPRFKVEHVTGVGHEQIVRGTGGPAAGRLTEALKDLNLAKKGKHGWTPPASKPP
jgi:hypothetical protein